MSTSVRKIVAERNHRTLLELVLKPGNDVCADCRARAPRWASYNLGIFICVSCASIHRKIGTHITKVKSITLDEWSKEQVEVMKEKGNIRSNELYNPDEAHHPPPTNMIDSERDSELEKFIRSKYEFKRFMNRKPGATSQIVRTNPRSAPTLLPPRSTPLTDSVEIARKSSPPGPPLPPKTPENLPSSLRPLATISPQNAPPTRSFTQPLPPFINSEKLVVASPLRPPAAAQSSIQKPVGQVWEDLVSLQGPSQSSSLPLQYSSASPIVSFPSEQVPVHQRPTTLGSVPNPFVSSSLGQADPTTPFVTGTIPVPVSTSSPQFPFVSSTPLSSPALHVGVVNPFNQAPLAGSANVNSTSSNPFLTSTMLMSMTTSTPSTPSIPPVMGLPTGALLTTPPLPYITSQTSTPAPAVSFPHTPFAAGPATPALAASPFGPVAAQGQMPLSASGATNPFSVMQIGQTGLPGASPQLAYGTTTFLSRQQRQQLGPNGFGGWAGQGAQGTFR